MPIDITQFGTRDAKIIRDNEGKTPYQLLQLGLSHKAYTRLAAQPSTTFEPETDTADGMEEFAPEIENEPKELMVNQPLQPDIVEATQRPAQPRLGRTSEMLIAARPPMNGQVTIVGPTGIPKQVAEKQARKLVAQNPNLYKII